MASLVSKTPLYKASALTRKYLYLLSAGFTFLILQYMCLHVFKVCSNIMIFNAEVLHVLCTFSGAFKTPCPCCDHCHAFFGVTVRKTAFVSLIYFMQVGLPMLCLYPLQYTAKSAIQHVPSPQIKFDCSGSMILCLFSLIVIVDRLFLFH